MATRLIKRIPLLLLISAFLALDFTLLFVNVHLTTRLTENAEFINITGRQRMLSQRISKHLIMQSYDISIQNTDSKKALFDAADLFNRTLLALKMGGELTSPEGRELTIRGLYDEESQRYIQQALAVWTPVYSMILEMKSGAQPDSFVIDLFAAQGSNTLLTLMNDLTIRTEQISKQNSAYLRMAQIAIFLAVLVNFFVIVIRLDIINRQQAKMTDQLKAMVSKLSEAVLLLDADDHIVFANLAAEAVLDQPSENMLGVSVHRYLHIASKSQQCVVGNRTFRLTRANVASVPSSLTMISLIDITEQMHLKAQSTRDVLTGVLNRHGLAEAYSAMRGAAIPISCLFLDLDSFKQINDLHGHATGDLVLSIVAKRFQGCLKRSDTLARIGGDEFIILIRTPRRENGLQELCERLEETIARPMVIAGKHCQLGVSIGWYTSSDDNELLEALIQAADQAMYAVKQRKRQQSSTVASPLKSAQ